MSAGRLNVLLSLQHFERPGGFPRLRWWWLVAVPISLALWVAIGLLVS